jgi:hypothetical protein
VRHCWIRCCGGADAKGARSAARRRQRTTHIFDQADSLGVTSLLMQQRFFRRSILWPYAPYQKKSCRGPAQNANVCYVRSCIGGKRQYRTQSDIFRTTTIPGRCHHGRAGKELGGDRHETEKYGTKAVGFLAASRVNYKYLIIRRRSWANKMMIHYKY